MTIKEVLIRAGELGEFPYVRIGTPIKNHPNTAGKIVEIKPHGIAVGLGAAWNKWFWSSASGDKRSTYMDELEFCDKPQNNEKVG